MKKAAFYNLFFIVLLSVSGMQSLFSQQDTTRKDMEVVYDYKSNLYIFQNKMGTLFTMTPDEYMKYSLKQLNSSYFKEKNAIKKKEEPAQKEPLSLFNLRKSNSLLEEIFGPGGVRVTTQGSIELTTGLKRDVLNNPTLPERSRKRNRFDLDQQIQLNVNAKVG
ncbi:MAG: hypothetical protein VB054_00510, partial [Petrimonas sp.]|nr:hypothetical protein [Petrimonas sp.]